MIQAHVSGDGLEPAGHSRAVPQLGKALVRFEEDLLRNIFGLCLIGDEAHSRAEYHVLVLAHKRLELFCVCHPSAATVRQLY